jgi:hypothetical protein
VWLLFPNEAATGVAEVLMRDFERADATSIPQGSREKVRQV